MTALFANSPFTDGQPNGFLSARSHIWLDTDNARSGMMPFAFEPGMGFERYVDYALDVPMYFVKRGDTYHDVAGDELPRSPGRAGSRLCRARRATMADWANHLSTIFPEVRLKRYLEMRGADVGARPMIVALGGAVRRLALRRHGARRGRRSRGAVERASAPGPAAGRARAGT